MKTICIYHKNCFDGICAAWVISKVYPNIEFIPMNYGDKFPWDIPTGTHIIMVDFSLPRKEMIALMERCQGNLKVLDHHKTAQANCEGLDFCIFDMNESGASLAWKYYFPMDEMPNLIRYIKDRDLWLFKEPDSIFINSWIQSFQMTLLDYQFLYEKLETEDGIFQGRIAGNAITRYKNQLIQQICATIQFKNIAGYLVPVANSPILMSEVGHELASRTYKELDGNRPAFGAYFFYRSDGVIQWGARSIGDFDVSEIAKILGGGGHKNAAGWQE